MDAQNALVYVKSTPRVVQPGAIGSRAALCPSGMKVLGGGADIEGKNTATVLAESYPIDDGDHGKVPDNGWRATMVSRSMAAKTLIAYAICTTSKKLTYTSSGIINIGSDRWTLSAPCPNGTYVTGGGGSLLYQVEALADIASTKPFDAADIGDIPDNGWETTFDNDTGVMKNAIAFAVCASSGTYQYMTPSGTVSPGPQQTMAVDCPGSGKVVGGGVSVTTNLGPDEAEIAASFPTDGLDGNTKRDDAWTASASNFSAGPLDMYLFAICKI